MFRNENMRSHTHTEKSKRYKTKKSHLHKKDANSKHSKDSKYAKYTKMPKNFKYSKLKHINSVSDYVGPERLTKHVGLFTKGKISDSISRIERIMPREVKARAQQDLLEVLKLTSSVHHHKRKKKKAKSVVSSLESISPVQSLGSSPKSPAYLQNKTGFASNNWKDKLQKSVGPTAVSSILTSVKRNNQPEEVSPVKKIQFIARTLLINKIHPFIKGSNELLFPASSHKDMLKNKLLYLKNSLLPPTIVTSEKASSSSINESPPLSSNNETDNSHNVPKEDFHLNPIFTGDDLAHSDISQIFPTANELAGGTNDLLVNNNLDYLLADTDVDDSISDAGVGDLITDDMFTDDASVDLQKRIYDPEKVFSQASSASIGGKSSLTLVQTSPTTSDDSPVFKLQVSPMKFVPHYESTPTIYFRHKMF